MRRRLDPLELEKLAHRQDEASPTPFDLMDELARAIVAAAIVSIFCLAGVFMALAGVPGF